MSSFEKSERTYDYGDSDGDDRPGAAKRRKRTPRPPKPPTHDSLERSALRYLERYESSEQNLRQVLERRARKALDAVDADSELRDRVREWILEIVAKAVSAKLVDDRRYAENLARQLQRRGTSHSASWHKLRTKGVSNELIREQLGSGPAPDEELAAATALARRRGLGPWRSAEARVERRERDLAALARAGFGYEIARQVVDAPSPDALPERRVQHGFF